MDTPASTLSPNLPGFLQDQGLSLHLARHGTDAGIRHPDADNGVGDLARVIGDHDAFDAADLADAGQASTGDAAGDSPAFVDAACNGIRENPLTSIGGAFALGWLLATLTR